ncbi:MAG: DUF2752 domain-containing protein [Ignavibacteriales bacterium]|nr:MAG: DUF2752 domain-containing protein [Ignavibacteriaceae bacterium]MBW7872892.1 DUF2752 domain-containing protein [Ignavibacteria bacterium]MCZ2142479.1 DUF2752 domain-containing protein [Ignavibacteriales bacterium]OQY70874.1 MAG: hypothetical protein B6D45_10755 [Ignavibacteriales bacterium UTCHB3]MBZ0196457.1 DUF2752 domain-containing protein [Ignavibacteriaceae bacterium]
MIIKQLLRFFRSSLFEALIWIGALIYLALYNPVQEASFSFCVLDNLGFEHCPGCGLGRSVSFLLHGDFQASWEAHKLGIFALIVLLFRSGQLIYQHINNQKQKSRLPING